MSEFWIVCGEKHEEHTSRELAVIERDKLRRHVPERTFRIYRCKCNPNRAEHFPKLVALLQDIVDSRCLAVPELRDRAHVLLVTIANRNGGLAFLKDCSDREFGS